MNTAVGLQINLLAQKDLFHGNANV